MQTFADWLKYYNNFDVSPFLEALRKMGSFYADRGIDILKDAVSLPGVSLQYLMRGTQPGLFSPGQAAYDKLKAAVVDGPSIVFTREHEADRTKIRDHQFDKARTCQKVLGYDSNALYLSTMSKYMPRGKEVITFNDPVTAARFLKEVYF